MRRDSRAARVAVAVTALALAVHVASPNSARAQAEAPQAQVIPGTSADVVMVDVVVVDGDGRPVSDLKASDFVLRDDSRPRPIEHFEAVGLDEVTAAARPRVSTNEPTSTVPAGLLVIVVDEHHLAPGTLARARRVVDSLLARGLRPGEELLLVGAGRGDVSVARDEAGLARLRERLEEMRGLRLIDPEEDLISDDEARRIVSRQDPHALRRATSLLYERERQMGGLVTYTRNDAARRSRGIRMGSYETLARALASRIWGQALARLRSTLAVVEGLSGTLAARRGRKSVVLVSDGFVLDHTLPEWKRTLEAARRANVAIYGLDTRGLGGDPAAGADVKRKPMAMSGATLEPALSYSQAVEGSGALATETGGFTSGYTNDLADALGRIAVESRNYYLLGFQPDAPLDGSYRKLAVEVLRPGLSVRARKGYYATPSADASPPPALRPIPLRLTAYVREPRGAAVHVQVVGEIDPGGLSFREEGGRSVATIDWLVETIPAAGGAPQQQPRRLTLALEPDLLASLTTTWLPVSAEFDLPPGAHLARLAVRQEGERRTGSVEHGFDVPPAATPFLSTPILSDMARGDGVEAPALLARRTFVAGSRLICELELHNAARTPSGQLNVSAGYEVRDASGRVLAQSAPTPLVRSSGGRLARLIWMSLEKTPAGRYALLIRVRDEVAGTTLETLEPFEVVSRAAPTPPASE